MSPVLTIRFHGAIRERMARSGVRVIRSTYGPLREWRLPCEVNQVVDVVVSHCKPSWLQGDHRDPFHAVSQASTLCHCVPARCPPFQTLPTVGRPLDVARHPRHVFHCGLTCPTRHRPDSLNLGFFHEACRNACRLED